MGMLMVAYPITRFLIEYLRNDEPAFVAGLTISQTISVVLLLVAVLYWAWLGKLPRRPQSPAISDSPSLAGEPVNAGA
jgi:phosphatidylglycerol:prolipoprotein diacylglycerol transferase